MILIVGGSGNMGRRYRAILDYIGEKWFSVDEKTAPRVIADIAKRSDGIIISTPTETHTEIIRQFSDFGVPILCEKPITKDLEDLKETLKLCEKNSTCLDMVYQYSELDTSDEAGLSAYDYFKHGSDGLYWDCIQIIGLAKGAVSIKEESPIWTCKINGKAINIANMDWAYVSFIRRWLMSPGAELDELYRIHERVVMLSEAMAHVF